MTEANNKGNNKVKNNNKFKNNKTNTGGGNGGGVEIGGVQTEEKKGGKYGRDGKNFKEAFPLTLTARNPEIKTLEVLKQKINPAGSKIEFVAFKKINDGKVVVICKDQTSRQNLINEVKKNTPQLEAKAPIKINPYLAIPRVNKEVKKEDVANAVAALAGSPPVHVAYSEKRETCYIEVTPEQHHACLKARKITIGWEVFRMYDHLYIKRCYKCQKIGHTAAKCCTTEKEIVSMKKIVENKKCSNCIFFDKNNEGHKHPVWDRNCPHYQKIEKIIRKNTKTTNEQK